MRHSVFYASIYQRFSIELWDMRMRKYPYTSLLAIIIIFISGIILAADNNFEKVSERPEPLEQIGITIEKVGSNEGIERCKHCGRFVRNGIIHRDAVIAVSKQLEEGLSSRKIGISGGKERDKFINVYIFRFEERKGGNYSVEKPAGVGFHMHLYENGAIKQIFVFDEDQKALTDNIFGIGKFFKRGGKWIGSDDAAALKALTPTSQQATLSFPISIQDSGLYLGMARIATIPTLAW